MICITDNKIYKKERFNVLLSILHARVIFSYRIVDMIIFFVFYFLRHICNIHFFLKILRGRVKAAKTPPFSGGVNTGLTQQEKEFQAFIVWIVIGPTIRSRIGVCATLCGVRCCSEKGVSCVRSGEQRGGSGGSNGGGEN